MTTGTRIRKYRDLAGLSQRELEKLTDISQSTIARLERDERIAKPYELSALALALGCLDSNLMENHPVRERLRYAARTTHSATPNTEPVKDHLFYLLEMDTYLARALSTLASA